MGHAHASLDAFSARMQNILHIANRLKEITSFSNSSSHLPFTSSGSHASVLTDSISLPTPCPLLPLLLEAGADRELATAASKIYELRAEELRKHIQESIVTAARKIAELPTVASASTPDLLIRKTVLTATEVYLQRLGQWKEEIVQRIEQASKLAVNAVAPKNSRTFNFEYVPLLERFFEENPFPTHADKMFLAKKSNMEYRQIHVWFQNRRNRTKKEGKLLRKKPTYEWMKPLDKQHKRMKGHAISDFHAPDTSKVCSSEGANGTQIARNDKPTYTFPSSSPPHAFPSPYPPVCHCDPFPCKSGPVQFSKPEWRRVSCGKLPLPLSTSIDELVGGFSRLNVRDEMRCTGSSKLLSHAATAAITVIPSRAPHPSLLLCEYRQAANTVQRHPIVRAGVSNPKVFQSSGPISEPATLVPPLVPHDRTKLPGKRKTCPLPGRLPSRMRNTCRDTTPSESSSTSSASPRLFSPDFESRNCSFSSVSSLSTPSDIASTQELPHLSGTPCCSPADSPIHLRKLGDIAAITPPPVS